MNRRHTLPPASLSDRNVPGSRSLRAALPRLGRLVAALALAATLLLSAAAVPGLHRAGIAIAADPTSTPAAAGDPRSSGEGAGLVGRPLVAIGGMLAIGLLAAAGTLVYVRLTGGPRRD